MADSRIKIEMISERKMIDVSPGTFREQLGRVYVDVCTKCAAVIFDPIAHDDWHRKVEPDDS